MKEKALQSTLESIGHKLITLRKKKGYTSHEAFAMDNNLPRVQYWRLEKGKVNFTFRTLGKVLAVHKLTIEEFFFTLNEKK
jgi:transcriptional regulator with XRE-family HTH domain